MESRAIHWQTSSYSQPQSNCVQVAASGSGQLIRDSKDPDGSWLRVPTAQWRAFAAGIRTGEFI